MVCHVLLVETEQGLVLVDTGLGLLDVKQPRQRLGPLVVPLMNPRLDEAETALRQVERLGFRREDVRHILLTHLDLDHAGGLSDFPAAIVHLMQKEHGAAMHPAGPGERLRYRSAQWSHDPEFTLYEPSDGEPWFGFDCVRALRGLPPELLLVPLEGHSRGHAGIAVEAERGWLLHAGDAYFHRWEMGPDRRRCPLLLDVFQRVVEVDHGARTRNQERLRHLVRENAGEVRVFSAHDPVELERFEV
jgi:glyoxylase-like metal-dependent hydrolase (beta-lactamase superfamily II)